MLQLFHTGLYIGAYADDNRKIYGAVFGAVGGACVIVVIVLVAICVYRRRTKTLQIQLVKNPIKIAVNCACDRDRM